MKRAAGHFLRRLFGGMALLLALVAPAAAERLIVTDPYIELRTGPGRGFPIFFVAGREEKIEILLRRTDWYKVRTEGGREGWVHRSQLETTLTEAGARKTFREIALDDYLQRRLELGAAWGLFKAEPMLKVWSAYRFSDALSVEATAGQVQGVFSGTDFWHLNLNVEPWSDRRLSPFFGIGFGRFKNIPNPSLVSAIPTHANLAAASVGLRYYLTDRFVARADWSIYTAYVADTRSVEYRAVAAGLSFFF
ncbi:MAG: SH3 domain-containing protein [Burkholderiaceae bacterium]|nr:SH3 domain-containing protein [Burkholderiaceae bacterium]